MIIMINVINDKYKCWKYLQKTYSAAISFVTFEAEENYSL